jgi:hypothetical protein
MIKLVSVLVGVQVGANTFTCERSVRSDCFVVVCRVKDSC